jgi:hypothetical protein
MRLLLRRGWQWRVFIQASPSVIGMRGTLRLKGAGASARHPNTPHAAQVIQFVEVFLTNDHVCIVME